MNDKRSTKSYKSHKRATKLTLLNCAWRCSSRLQKIQSWEILFQRPSKVHNYQYTKTQTIFLFFQFFLLKKKKTLKQSFKTNKQTKHQKLDWLKLQQPTMHEIKKVKESLGIFFLPDRRPGWRIFLLHNPLFRWIKRKLESIEIR